MLSTFIQLVSFSFYFKRCDNSLNDFKSALHVIILSGRRHMKMCLRGICGQRRPDETARTRSLIRAFAARLQKTY